MPEIGEACCTHCGTRLQRVELPEALFDHLYDLACFNDDCPYYVRGWAWMEKQFGVRSSYRYRVDSRNGRPSPLPVWSPTALRNCILPDDFPVVNEARKELP